MDISIIIPCFNEGKNVITMTERITAALAHTTYQYEILFIDDSKDNTFELIAKYINEKSLKSRIKTIRGKGIGKGAAVKAGIQEASGEIIFYLDSDLTIPLNNIDIFIEEIKRTNSDGVIGRRILSKKGKSLIRYIFSLALLILGRSFIFHSNYFYDTQCGFKVFKKESIKKLTSKQCVNDGMFDLELLYIAKLYNMQISQITVTPLPEIRKSVLQLGKCVWKDPLDLLAIKVNRLLGKYN